MPQMIIADNHYCSEAQSAPVSKRVWGLLKSLSYDPDLVDGPANALQVDSIDKEGWQPMHRHRKGQFVISVRGGVMCKVPGTIWMVPPDSGVWIPSGMLHCNRALDNASVCFLFIDASVTGLPLDCCTLAISPMLREMILHLASASYREMSESRSSRFLSVVLDELRDMPVESLHVPMPDHPRLRAIAETWIDCPNDRNTLAEWARISAMSERSLARLVQRETGLSFSRWRLQFNIMFALRALAGGATVQQTAFELGYESPSAFITMFKKALGKPPGQYVSEHMVMKMTVRN